MLLHFIIHFRHKPDETATIYTATHCLLIETEQKVCKILGQNLYRLNNNTQNSELKSVAVAVLLELLVQLDDLWVLVGGLVLLVVGLAAGGVLGFELLLEDLALLGVVPAEGLHDVTELGVSGGALES